MYLNISFTSKCSSQTSRLSVATTSARNRSGTIASNTFVGVVGDQFPALLNLVNDRGDDEGEEDAEAEEEKQNHQRDRTGSCGCYPPEEVYHRHQHRGGDPGEDKRPEDSLRKPIR